MSREILRFATFEIVYVVIGTIYALCLYKLNSFLVESGIAENYMDVILYKKGISIYFFIIGQNDSIYYTCFGCIDYYNHYFNK